MKIVGQKLKNYLRGVATRTRDNARNSITAVLIWVDHCRDVA
ncbi:hypothetical protein [Hydrocoleum sp. CS-953]|nr:hypothetical protein [Hydrocoleum sp. CS-953]